MTAQDAEINSPSCLPAHTEITKSLIAFWNSPPSASPRLSPKFNLLREFPDIPPPSPHESNLLTCLRGKTSLCSRQAGKHSTARYHQSTASWGATRCPLLQRSWAWALPRSSGATSAHVASPIWSSVLTCHLHLVRHPPSPEYVEGAGHRMGGLQMTPSWGWQETLPKMTEM